MSKLRIISGTIDEPKVVGFFCSGCNEEHQVFVKFENSNGATWNFNGNFDSPTFTPSLLVRSGHYVPYSKSDECWCTYNEKHPNDPIEFSCLCCHMIITDGKIKYLKDSSHHLSGKIVDMSEQLID